MRSGRPIAAMGMAAALMALLCPALAAALEVRVHGESQLDVELDTAGTTVRFYGQLQDDLGDPLPVQRLDVALRDQGEVIYEDAVYTDFHGRFSTFVEVATGTYAAEVQYDGASHVAGTRRGETIHVESEPPQLAIDAPRWVYGFDASVPLEIQARAGDKGLPGYAAVAVDGRPVASINLDHRGQGTFDASSELDVGDNTIAVAMEATEFRDEARAQTAVRSVQQVEFDGHIERVFRRGERGQQIELSLLDSQGPIDEAAIELRLERDGDTEDGASDREEGVRLVEDLKTGEDGAASVLIPDDALDEYRWEVSAVVDPPSGEPIVWQGDTIEQQTPAWLRAVPILAMLALVAGLLWMARSRLAVLWRRLREYWTSVGSSPGDSTELPELPELERVEDLEVVSTGGEDVESRDPTVAVIELWDTWRGRPVSGAEVVVESRESTTTLESGEQGRIDISVPDAGEVRLRAKAPGYVPARASLDSTALDGTIRMAMTAVPLKIRRAYRQMVRRARGDDPWGRLTPRQLQEALRSSASIPETAQSPGDTPGVDKQLELSGWGDDPGGGGDDPQLDALLKGITQLVEETNYSGRHYGTEVWETARQAMQQLIAGLEDQCDSNQEAS